VSDEANNGAGAAPEFPGGLDPADVQRHLDRETAIRRAAAAALPGPLREAFAGDPPRVHGFTLQPVTAGLIAVLERIKSPFLAIIREVAAHQKDGTAPDAAIAAIQADPESGYETVFCFTTPIAELRALLNKGRELFRETAGKKVGDKLHPVHLAELQRACGLHFGASFATVVEYKPDTPEGGGGFPSPAARTTTGSAGGSASSEP
jgi:hypothetical protein